jgi:hypothetical protein
MIFISTKESILTIKMLPESFQCLAPRHGVPSFEDSFPLHCKHECEFHIAEFVPSSWLTYHCNTYRGLFSRICGVDLFEKIKSMVYLVKISANMNFIHGNLCRWTVFAKSCINECFIWNVNTGPDVDEANQSLFIQRDTMEGTQLTFFGHLGGMAQLH